MMMEYFAIYRNCDITRIKRNIAQVLCLGVDIIPYSQAWVRKYGGQERNHTDLFCYWHIIFDFECDRLDEVFGVMWD